MSGPSQSFTVVFCAFTLMGQIPLVVYLSVCFVHGASLKTKRKLHTRSTVGAGMNVLLDCMHACTEENLTAVDKLVGPLNQEGQKQTHRSTNQISKKMCLTRLSS